MSRLRTRYRELGEGIPERRLISGLLRTNFPGAAVAALKAAGHDMVWARMAAPRKSDPNDKDACAAIHSVAIVDHGLFGAVS
jgi:hypothetical protein